MPYTFVVCKYWNVFVFTVVCLLRIGCQADEEYTEPRRARAAITTGYDGKTLIVGTFELPLYMRVLKGATGTEYDGYIPDLLRLLSRRFHFDFKYVSVASADVGEYKDGSWSGLMGDLISEKVDILAAPITVTAEREKFVDFVSPFQHNGVSVVVLRQDIKRDDQTFSFTVFQPLAPSVWGTVICAVVVVGLFFWLMNMYNPYEWRGRYNVGLAEKSQAEAFGLAGSLWFAFTVLQWQGFNHAPRCLASRLMGCVWMAFCTVFLITFSAGIANNLYWASLDNTASGAPPDLVDLEHVMMQKDFSVGTIIHSQAYEYVNKVARGFQFDMLRMSWKTEQGWKQLVSSVNEGLERVRKGKYAFIVDSLTANYMVNKRPCDLTIIGPELGRRGYGMAVRRNSSLLEPLHAAILQLSEEGELEDLQKRWFANREECWNDTRARRAQVNSVLYASRPKSVDTTTFWGPLVLVILGGLVSCIIATIEILYYKYRGRYGPGRPQRQQMQLEPDEGNI